MITKKDATLQFLETWGKTFRENAVLHESKKDERYLVELRLMRVCANCIYILARLIRPIKNIRNEKLRDKR